MTETQAPLEIITVTIEINGKTSTESCAWPFVVMPKQRAMQAWLRHGKPAASAKVTFPKLHREGLGNDARYFATDEVYVDEFSHDELKYAEVAWIDGQRRGDPSEDPHHRADMAYSGMGDAEKALAQRQAPVPEEDLN